MQAAVIILVIHLLLFYFNDFTLCQGANNDGIRNNFNQLLPTSYQSKELYARKRNNDSRNKQVKVVFVQIILYYGILRKHRFF